MTKRQRLEELVPLVLVKFPQPVQVVGITVAGDSVLVSGDTSFSYDLVTDTLRSIELDPSVPVDDLTDGAGNVFSATPTGVFRSNVFGTVDTILEGGGYRIGLFGTELILVDSLGISLFEHVAVP